MFKRSIVKSISIGASNELTFSCEENFHWPLKVTLECSGFKSDISLVGNSYFNRKDVEQLIVALREFLDSVSEEGSE